MVGDREGAQVHDASEAERRRSVGGLSRSVLGEDHLGSADDAFLTLPGVVWREVDKVSGIFKIKAALLYVHTSLTY